MRITLAHAGALGDTILLVPLLRALKTRYPGAAITLVMRPAFGQLLSLWGEADAWASMDDPLCSRWFAADAEHAPAWADCDLLLSAVSDGRDAWSANARRLSPRAQLLFFQPRPPADFPGHVSAYHHQQLATLALAEPSAGPVLRNPDGPILIHPGSGGEAKCWPREYFLQLGRDLKRNGILPTFILGEAEQERWGQRTIAQLQDEFPWYLHMGLYELSEKMRRARLYIGNDSGVSHLAGAVGLPSLILFGPSNDVQWRPWGPAIEILRAPTAPQDLTQLSPATVLTRILAT